MLEIIVYTVNQLKQSNMLAHASHRLLSSQNANIVCREEPASYDTLSLGCEL